MVVIALSGACCGCTACVNRCPKKCITMQQDAEGFLYPVVNQKNCIKCGLCEKVCPIINHISNRDLQITYIAYAKDITVRKESSSGGIFSLIAKEILSQGGIVFGAAYDESFKVCHIAVSTEAELYKLRGSKYTQSDLGNSFREAKQALAENKKVLFSGTACQIAGLVSYIGGKADNLYTIDVLCHGVPSPKLWQQYVNYQAKKGKITNISQRNKDYGWKGYHVKIDFASSLGYCVPYWEDRYSKLFLGDVALRPSCYNCRYKVMDRPSDITLGDCWGIENFCPSMDDDMGTSVVVLHTSKGREIYERLQSVIIDQEVELNKVLPESSHARKSVKPHINRNKLGKMLKKNDFTSMEKLMKLNVFQKAARKMKRKLVRRL